ncbi:MAG: recombinase family protein [Thermomicrobiales bacterium]
MAERGKPTRCAIYTRKSSEEGLEQEFNSLHAQREACEAYVRSQKHEGWSVLPTLYDDGGFSGGSMERPALQRLLQDVRDRRVDVVVVYKIDRLTRSLFDFAKIVETFDAVSVSFVSVTQSFNTTSSMGRLTLNVLLSFAQFEREVTGERIRDKIAASKRKGMFMGGNIPLGYDLVDHGLVVNSVEAETVRTIFELYIRLGTVRLVKAELDRRGLMTKLRTIRNADGAEHTSGGEPFYPGHIYYLLRNPTYIGSVRHKGVVHPGRHQPIMDIDTWNAVQAKLASNAVERQRETASSNSILVSRVFDTDGNRLTPTHAVKGTRRYRYYATTHNAGSTLRISAADLERAVADAVASWLREFGNVSALTDDPQQSIAAYQRAQELAALLTNIGHDGAGKLRRLVLRVECDPARLTLHLDRAALMDELGLEPSDTTTDDTITIATPLTLVRRGKIQRLVIASTAIETPNEDPALAIAILRARTWFERLKNREVASIAELATSQQRPRAWMSQQLPLAFLAPDIVETIAAGRQPATWTIERLVAAATASPDWSEQRAALR